MKMTIKINTYLSFAIDTHDATGSLERGSYENSVSTNAIHIDASTSLNVVKVNVTILRDQIDDVILWRHLHCNGKIILCLRWKKDINLLFLVRLITTWG